MKTYSLSQEMVNRALKDGETYNLAIALAETNEPALLKEIITELFHQATNDTADYGMTVEQYLYETLEDSENVKSIDAFDSEAAAEKEGFFWDDTLGKWLKLNFAF